MGGTEDCTTDSTESASAGKRSLRMLSICASFMNAPRSSFDRATTRSAFRMCAARRACSVLDAERNGRCRACQR